MSIINIASNYFKLNSVVQKWIKETLALKWFFLFWYTYNNNEQNRKYMEILGNLTLLIESQLSINENDMDRQLSL